MLFENENFLYPLRVHLLVWW